MKRKRITEISLFRMVDALRKSITQWLSTGVNMDHGDNVILMQVRKQNIINCESTVIFWWSMMHFLSLNITISFQEYSRI